MSKKDGLSVMSRKAHEWQKENMDSGGLCVGRFKADVVLDDLPALEVGDEFEIDGVAYKVVREKECHSECEIDKKSCQLRGNCYILESV